jgi:PTS system galactitol-specific IIB component
VANKKVYKIASVCGAGLATSTWIATKLKDKLAERGIDTDISEVKIMDLGLSASNYDLIVSASNLGDVYGVPTVVSTSILTGIGLEDTIEEIVKILEGSENKKEEE